MVQRLGIRKKKKRDISYHSALLLLFLFLFFLYLRTRGKNKKNKNHPISSVHHHERIINFIIFHL